MYNKRTWLNKDKSPSTGNVVAFEGETLYRGESIHNIFLSISDCSVSARLHKTDEDSIQDFVDKMKLLEKEIHKFVKHLEKINGEKR